MQLKELDPRLHTALQAFSKILKTKHPEIITSSHHGDQLIMIKKELKQTADQTRKNLPDYGIFTEVIQGIYWSILYHKVTKKVAKLYVFGMNKGRIQAYDYRPIDIYKSRTMKEQLDYLENIYHNRILTEQRYTVLGPLLQEIQSPLTTFNIPNELKTAIAKYKGQYTTKSGRDLAWFLSLDPNDDKKLNSIVSVYNYLVQKKYIGDLTIPFAEDGAGNYFCFQYKNSNDSNPTIVFWDHESSGGVSKEANSFKEFLSSLKETKQEKQHSILKSFGTNPKQIKKANPSILSRLKSLVMKEKTPLTVDIQGEKLQVNNVTSADGKQFDEKRIPDMVKLINKNYSKIVDVFITDLYNTYSAEWNRTGGTNITKEQFVKGLKPEFLTFYADGGAEIALNDGSGLFLQHILSVYLEPNTMLPEKHVQMNG